MSVVSLGVLLITTASMRLTCARVRYSVKLEDPRVVPCFQGAGISGGQGPRFLGVLQSFGSVGVRHLGY